MVKYVFDTEMPAAIKAAKDANPQAIGEAIAKVKSATTNPKDLAAHVLEAAKNRRNPLHKHFEWDDAVAGHKYRLEQARSIIRLIRVEPTNENDRPTRAFISVKDSKGVAYRDLGEIKRSADLQISLLKQARADLESFRERYAMFRDLFPEVDTALSRIDARIDADQRAAA
jgi:hypothetical protein